MKKVFLMIVLVGVSLLSVQSGNVPLYGDLLGSGPTKDPSQTPPVEVYQYPASIEVSFLIDLGELCIEITGESGAPVFQTVEKAAAGSSVPINTGSWEPGKYTLVITDGLGGCLEGNFVIDK